MFRADEWVSSRLHLKLEARWVQLTLQTYDQGVSSLVNLSLTVFVARVGGIAGLSGINFVFTAYICALGLMRAGVCEPLLSSSEQKGARGAVVLSCFGGLLIGAPLAVWLAISDNHAWAWIVAFPLLLTFDVIRYVNIRAGRNYIAALLDSCWLCLMVLGCVLFANDVSSVIQIWVITCSIALGFGAVLSISLFRGDRVRKFRDCAAGISAGSLVESAIYQIVWQLGFAGVLAAVGGSLAGTYRAGLTLFAPMGVIASAFSLLSFRTLLRTNPDMRLARARHLSLVISLIAVVYLVVVLVASVPLTNLLFSHGVSVGYLALILIGIQFPLTAWTSQYSVYLKVTRQAIRLIGLRIIGSLVLVAYVGICVAVARGVSDLNEAIYLTLPVGMACYGIGLVFVTSRLSRRETSTK